MAQADQVVHAHDGAGDVVATHGVDSPDPAGNDHHGHPGREIRELACRHLRPDQHQALASIVDERPQSAWLVAVRRDPAEHHVVAELIGGDIHTVDEVGVELLPRSERHPDEPGPMLT